MTIQLLDHVNICTRDLNACMKFYADILGFENGPRPQLGVPGAWMYCGEQAVIHIMAFDEAPEGTTGPIDHVAFRCTGFDEMKARMDNHGLDYSANEVPDFNIRQLFVRDPDGVKIELNFFGE